MIERIAWFLSNEYGAWQSSTSKKIFWGALPTEYCTIKVFLPVSTNVCVITKSPVTQQ